MLRGGGQRASALQAAPLSTPLSRATACMAAVGTCDPHVVRRAGWLGSAKREALDRCRGTRREHVAPALLFL